jgi:hypothetical protein
MNKIYLHCRQWMGNALGVLNMRILIMLISLALCFSANAGGHLVKGVGKTSAGKSAINKIQIEQEKIFTDLVAKKSHVKEIQKTFNDISCHKNNHTNESASVQMSFVDKKGNVIANAMSATKLGYKKNDFSNRYLENKLEKLQKQLNEPLELKFNALTIGRKNSNTYKKIHTKNFLHKKWPDKFRSFKEDDIWKF